MRKYLRTYGTWVLYSHREVVLKNDRFSSVLLIRPMQYCRLYFMHKLDVQVVRGLKPGNIANIINVSRAAPPLKGAGGMNI